MAVVRFEELDAWKLSSELESVVWELSEHNPLRNDIGLTRQLRRAAGSAPALIAEGWGRFSPTDFANFVRMAKGSLNETKSHLLGARRKQLISQSELDQALQIFFRAVGATAALGRYLRSPEARRAADAIRDSSSTGPER